MKTSRSHVNKYSLAENFQVRGFFVSCMEIIFYVIFYILSSIYYIHYFNEKITVYRSAKNSADAKKQSYTTCSVMKFILYFICCIFYFILYILVGTVEKRVTFVIL